MDSGDREQQRKENGNGGWLKVLEFAAAVIGAFVMLKAGGGKATSGQDIQQEVAEEQHLKRQVLQGWVIVCAMSLAFVLYGLFALVVVGDKGPPDWDFGAVEDVPGQSPYSTYPYRGRTPEPEPQHVDRRPAAAATGMSAEQGPPIPKKGME